MVNNRILNVIIHGCRCVIKQTVKGLKLPVEKHPRRYTIGWIKSRENISTERYKLTFYISKYKDEVYCDIVDVDACQLLFGRS